ncbi:MAG: NAD(P)/FAD-dependent oxidoreductase [Rhodothermaceae bacterium]|nr:NAD(P)/FAD-dependent oxidoreductase [Rhodothermaceae bacterium]MYC04983.1 NAD(P)/FAD-dependent oxidoreductase [Rhodothermaceae bacterium]MYI18041.1 NAD(P)/FAD-dependent oxidoreductase [Rhodothermaceae bacterium]
MARRIVIIGNGITGVTAARFVRKLSDDSITVVSSETDHFYARTALMYIYMGHMRYQETKPYEDHFWSKNRINLVRGYASRIDPEQKVVRIADGNDIAYDALLLATGSQSNKFGWPGQDLMGVQGLYGMQDLALMEQNTQNISHGVVVGGGLIGIEMAEMLHARHIPVTFLVREKSYMDYLLPKEESALINREIYEHGIDLRLDTELKSILGSKSVEAVETSNLERIECQFVGLTAGVHPNMDLAKASGIETSKGIVVNEFFETNVPDIYAAGDCAEFNADGIGSRRIEQLWYTGRAHGKVVARTLCGHRTQYRRGIFFNSAKFFTIEYQTYGDVPAQPGSHIRSQLFQGEKKLLRINSDRNTGRVLGFNAMGLRLRQDQCEAWIRSGSSVKEVLASIGKARFDAEFYSSAVYRQAAAI